MCGKGEGGGGGVCVEGAACKLVLLLVGCVWGRVGGCVWGRVGGCVFGGVGLRKSLLLVGYICLSLCLE